jgi:hypothetical protein
MEGGGEKKKKHILTAHEINTDSCTQVAEEQEIKTN